MNRTSKSITASKRIVKPKQSLSPSLKLLKSSSVLSLKLPSLTKSQSHVRTSTIARPGVTPRKRSWKLVASEKPSLDRFRLYRVIGTGTFSRVRIARVKHSSEVVILKIMRKVDIVKKRQIEHVKNEKNILTNLSHPFIVNLKATFQDRDNLYIVQEYVPGGEMYRLLRSKGNFSYTEAKFYLSEVICGLAYIHSHGYIYRDLKPENILITELGHVKITDFGFAKSIKDHGKTFTLCGTPEYLAPEVIRQVGHDYSCDWWGCGILLYEMICGHAPYYDSNPYKLYEKIISDEVVYPRALDETTKDFLMQILNKNPEARASRQDIMRHPFFQNINWSDVNQERLVPPHIPIVREADDASNFDEYEDEPERTDTVPVSLDLFADF